MKRIIILILALMLLIVGCQSPSKDATATKEHYFVSTKVEPTCTEDGYTAFTCTRCYFSYQENIVPATGHSFKTSADGTSKTCTACEYTETLPYTGGELETLSVHYIDVGQGDCIFIKVGDCDIIIDAGYSETYADRNSQYLLGIIGEQIKADQSAIKSKKIKSVEKIQEWWSETMDDDSVEMKDRIRCSENLAKSQGAFIEKVELNGQVNNPMAGLTTEELKKLIGND